MIKYCLFLRKQSDQFSKKIEPKTYLSLQNLWNDIIDKIEFNE